MATLHVVTGDQYRIVDRRMREIMRQLDQKEGSPLEPNKVATVLDVLQGIIEGNFSGRSEFLKLISGGEHLVIDPVDGSEILAEAKDVFTYIDPDFQNWKVDEPGSATEEISACVYERVNDATFAQMFGSLSADVTRLCFSQAQIKSFVRKYRQLLQRNGYATFFLFRSHNQFFVAGVHIGSGSRLGAYVYRFGCSDFKGARGRHRMVVPQLV